MSAYMYGNVLQYKDCDVVLCMIQSLTSSKLVKNNNEKVKNNEEDEEDEDENDENDENEEDILEVKKFKYDQAILDEF